MSTTTCPECAADLELEAGTEENEIINEEISSNHGSLETIEVIEYSDEESSE